MTILAFSLDFDGCGDILVGYLNDKYDYLKYDRQINHTRSLFTDHLTRQSNLALTGNVIVLCGSNRQSPYLDKLIAESHKKFPDNFQDRDGRPLSKAYYAHRELPKFAHKQGWSYDTLLLSDIDKKYITVSINGVTETIDCNRTYEIHPRTKKFLNYMMINGTMIPWGHAIKIALVQKQINHLSNQYPNEAIDYQFYDDRPEFLRFIEKFVTVPNNVKLTNFKVDYFEALQGRIGDFIVPSPSIKGKKYNQLKSLSMQKLPKKDQISKQSVLNNNGNTRKIALVSALQSRLSNLQSHQTHWCRFLFSFDDSKKIEISAIEKMLKILGGKSTTSFHELLKKDEKMLLCNGKIRDIMSQYCNQGINELKDYEVFKSQQDACDQQNTQTQRTLLRV